MKEVCDLDKEQANFGWCFDCVPEENSLYLKVEGELFEMASNNLVFYQTRNLLGGPVESRFGQDFPIRFDFLDTMGGGNLSLQVHPTTQYIRDTFGIYYTQDESYYLLDTQGDGACVYLGIKTGTDPKAMEQALEDAQAGLAPFPAEEFVNRIPVKKHDHVLIPAGTVHCSGADTMVLEISATPYIFTFKMWDWGRLDLDGHPRPIHLRHGIANIQWERNTEWVEQNIVNQVTLIHKDESGSVERTGLHEREFLDTFRVSTADIMPIRRNGSVHVMNLVDGQRAMLISAEGQYEPFELHYAETCIIPEAAGAYSIQAIDGEPVKAIIACVRN